MRGLIVCALFVVASAQLFPFWNGHNSDRHADYIFEYKSRHNIMLIRNSKTCYIADVDKDTVTKFHDKTTRDALEDDIIKHIGVASNLHKETTIEALQDTHDISIGLECRRKTIYKLDFLA